MYNVLFANIIIYCKYMHIYLVFLTINACIYAYIFVSLHNKREDIREYR